MSQDNQNACVATEDFLILAPLTSHIPSMFYEAGQPKPLTEQPRFKSPTNKHHWCAMSVTQPKIMVSSSLKTVFYGRTDQLCLLSVTGPWMHCMEAQISCVYWVWQGLECTVWKHRSAVSIECDRALNALYGSTDQLCLLSVTGPWMHCMEAQISCVYRVWQGLE